jgi:flagellar protein FlbD
MILLTRLDGKELVVNADQILTVEATPDTVLLLAGGLHLMVKERPDEVVERTLAYKRRCSAGPERRGTLVALARPPDAQE